MSARVNRHPRSLIVTLIAGAAGVILLAACSTATDSRIRQIDLNQPAVIPTAPADGESFPLAPPSAERGAAIYAEKCAACHGTGGAGDGARAAQIKEQGRVVANLVNPARARSVKPSEWHTTITVGRIQNLMPGFSGSLNGQDRWDVQAYVWSLFTPKASLDAGRAIFAQQCATCHGPAGIPDKANVPSFADGRWLAEASLLDIAGKMIQGDAHKDIKLGESERLQTADAVRALAYAHADPAELRVARTSGDGVLVLGLANGTPGGRAATDIARDGAPVILRALDQNGEVFSRTAPLASNGIVTFTGLPQRNDYFYQAEYDYADGRFYGAPTQLFTNTQTVTDIIPIFETTDDAKNISINNVLIAVQNIGEGELTMVEIYEFDHAGDRAYVGTNGRTLRISAPKDAQNIRFDGLGLGKRFFQDGEVIYDTDVTAPGTPAQRITMIYELPYREGATIERKLLYPLQRWNVFLPDTTDFPGTPLTAAGTSASALKDEGVRDADNVKVRIYAGEKPAGDTIRFELRGQPLGVAQPGADTAAIGVALIGLALTLGLGYLLMMRVRTIRAQMRSPLQTRQLLLRQIAELDDTYAAGKLKHTDYAAQRARLKEELREWWE